MRSGRRWAAALAALVVAGGCGTAGGPTEPGADAKGDAPTVPAGDVVEVDLAFGAEAAVSNAVLRFTGVGEDSRCPVDVVCVWAGNAAIELTAREGAGSSLRFVVNSTVEPRSVEAAGLRISLLEVQPAPRSDAALRPEDYRVRLRVEPGG